jgi:hypothetical protein
VSTYRLYDFAIDSDLELPELDPAGGPARFRVRLGSLPPAPDSWISLWPPDPGGPWIRVQRLAGGYRIRYEDQVEFDFSAARQEITVEVLDCPPETLRHFLLDQVLPQIVSLDAPILHASAVIVDGHVVAFAGRGGVGKSTLAAMLEQAGHSIASDDGLLVRRVGAGLVGVPSYSGLRLWPPMIEALAPAGSTEPVSFASKKRRVRGALRFDVNAAPLDVLYAVSAAPAEETAFTPLSARDTAMLFVEHRIRLEQWQGASLRRELEAACDAASRVRAFALAYPRAPAEWPSIARTIVAHVRDTVARPCCS